MATLFDDASLVMIPSGYKDDKLYSIKPTSGDGDFTFSRDGSGASPATRVNSAGLIEKGRTNLLLQSNQFDTTWANAATTETSGEAGYDGTNDAWLLDKSASGGYIYQDNTQSGVLNCSVYAKAGTLDWMNLTVNGSSTFALAYFDLANGTINTTQGSGFIDAQIQDIGSGWYRCSVTTKDGSSRVRIYPADGDNDTSGTSGNIYIQDSQLEKGLVATSVIETTTAAASAGILGDMPRLDYSGGATCPSLLLEPARTNSLSHSEYFNAWTKVGASVTDNNTESPEGYINAATISVSSTNDRISLNGSAFISGDTYTASVYLKGSGTISLNIGTSSGGGVENEEQITLTNDWIRHDITYTAPSTTGSWRLMLIKRSGDTATAFDVYGAQAEASSYPTSYVPSYGSATARAADSCSKTGISSLIGQSEGTLFFELKDTNNFTGYLGVDNGSTGTRILIYGINDEKVYTQVRNAATVIFGATSSVISGGAKAAIAFNSSGSVFYVNGVQVSSGSGTTYTNLSQVTFNHSSQIGAKVKQAVLFDTRLSNAELATLTTL